MRKKRKVKRVLWGTPLLNVITREEEGVLEACKFIGLEIGYGGPGNVQAATCVWGRCGGCASRPLS